VVRRSGVKVNFIEVGPAVFVLRYPVLDVSVTLILGETSAAVVDTLSSDRQARELRDVVRTVTALPLVLVNTHYHFDHSYGNRILAEGDRPIWGHEAAARALREDGEQDQRLWYEMYRPTHPDLAEELAAVSIRPPDHTVHRQATVDLGGRVVELLHFGRGHTDGDIVVSVADASVLVAGDLVESAGPPSFGDAYPLEWPETVGAILHVTTPATVVVPGHGPAVDVDFVRAQHNDLTELAWLIRDGHADGAPAEAIAAKAPFDPPTALKAVRRGLAELGGRL
jgi:glyoxylase-like metal-dependent hydrolase (beta-lactamase superfamily II)